VDSLAPQKVLARHSLDTSRPTLISLSQRDAYLLLLPLDRASVESLLKQLQAVLPLGSPTATSPGVGGTSSICQV